MITILSKMFIKNHEDVTNPQTREKYGMLCGGLGIFLNIVLFIFKVLAGIASKSVAVTADAFNNMSDAAASIVTLMGFKLSGRKPDADHPFGHGRIEYIAGLIVSFLILLMGLELLKSSILSVVDNTRMDTSTSAIIILTVSIVVKLYMYSYNHKIGIKINSAAMEAVARDSLNDTISTTVVLATVVMAHIFPNIKFPLDGIAGICVALFILYGGYDSIKETVNPLLGNPADKEFAKKVEEDVMSHKPICGIHDLIVHDYGPGRLMVSLHAEVPGNYDIFSLHDVIDNAEKSVSQKFGCMTTIHMDPVDIGNPELATIKEYLEQTACTLGQGFSIHDVRIVPGDSHVNVIFDVVKPHGCTYTDAKITGFFEKKISDYNEKYNCVVQIDNPYI